MNKWTKAASTTSLVLATAWSGTAFAAGPAQQTPAEQHFNEAMALFQQGEVDHACTVFEQSYAEGAAPGTLYNLSICRERQGRFDDAYRGFDELATRAEASPGHEDKAASVRARANALIPKLSRLDLVHRKDARSDVTGLLVDKTVLLADAWQKPVYVMPGTHTVLIKHADGTEVTRTTTPLVAGAAQTLEMEDPAPLPDTPLGPNASAPLVVREQTVVNKKERLASYILGGFGAASLVAGGIFGIVAIVKRTKTNSFCPNNTCPNQTALNNGLDARHTGKVFATLSDITLPVGAAAVGAAVYLYINSSRKETADTTAAWSFTPTGDAHGAGALLSRSF